MAVSLPLHRMFTAVPRRYDLINRLITWGQDEGWRIKAARVCLEERPPRVLDLCCGTGDLAKHLAELAGAGTAITGLDFALPMLEVAAGKVGDDKRVSLVYGNASTLPFPDGSFDAVGISFAFRNLTYKNPLARRCLGEVCRVLRPGGRFVIVETSQPRGGFIRAMFHVYLRWFVSRLGYALSGNKGAYVYLAESGSKFYPAEELREMLLGTGFSHVTFRRMLFGAVALHVAVK